MKKKSNKTTGMVTILFILLCFMGTGYVYSQLWEQLTKKERPTFLEIQQAAYQFYDGLKTGRKPGFKQFKRWEWFARNRLDREGVFNLSLNYQGWLEKEFRFGPPGTSGSANAAWTPLGPFTNTGISGVGRLNCIEFDPQNNSIIWVGAPTGGLWKSTDAGQSWSTSTDHLPNLGVSDIVIHPGNSSIMYIATGDKQRGSALSYGIMKSTDGGVSWQPTALRPGVEEKFKIGKLMMHPDNGETLLCAVNKGIYKTTNGGDTWQLKMDGDFFDLEVHPSDSSTWFASRASNGVYRSTDSGESWTRLTAGLPNPARNFGRIALAVSPSSPGTVYAVYCRNVDSQGWIWGLQGFFKSSDNGNSWSRKTGTPNILGWEADGSGRDGQGGYALVLEVNPGNPDMVIAGSVNLWKSENGGTSWELTAFSGGAAGVASVHADHHELAYLPGSSSTLFSCNDGGLRRSDDNGNTWTDLGSGLVIQQIYRLGLSAQRPEQMVAGAQDNGSELFTDRWNSISGGDGMECIIDPNNPNTVYSGWQFGNFLVSRDSGSTNRGIFQNTEGPFSWIAPFVMDPADSNTLYTASTRVYKSSDQGGTSAAISPVLTATPLTIMKIAPSNSNIILVSDGSRMFKTQNGGASWEEPDTSLFLDYITDAAFHPFNPDIIWVTIGGYGRWNSQFTWWNIPYEIDKPKVFYSTDGGNGWTDISGQIPNVPATCIVIDPYSLGVYLGTDLGVFYSASGTGDWEPFDNGLPNVIVTEMEIHESARKIVAATYGRGLWESPLADRPSVYPPLFFSGQREINRAFLQAERIDVLSWAANPNNNPANGGTGIAHYRLYLVTGQTRVLIAEPDNNTFEYWNRRVEARPYRYALTAMDLQGNESVALLLTLNTTEE
ncbi:MAG: hypothetical protein GY940_40390 [bacterium]|nr:hypothetical protein [bacterium]